MLPPGTCHLPCLHPHAIPHTATTTSALGCLHCRHQRCCHTVTLTHAASLVCAASRYVPPPLPSSPCHLSHCHCHLHPRVPLPSPSAPLSHCHPHARCLPHVR